MKDNVQAVNDIFYYMNNCPMVHSNGFYGAGYVPDVIVEASWTCSVEHITDKYLGYDASPDVALFKLYAELDSDNRRILTEWIINNYNSGVAI